MSFNSIAEILHRLACNLPVNFELLDDKGYDVFEIENVNDGIVIRGNNNIAITRGLYEYLRESFGFSFTWSGQNISTQNSLPAKYFKRVQSPYRYRLYMNMCTFSYSTVWWDWDKWQRELDWMALHGINMPLALIGQEYIWQKTWNKLGITNNQLTDFFTGPAYLAWNRSGNINGFAGPLPQNWIENQHKLQQKILKRMHELDMHPIVPAFSGYVPNAFVRMFPNEEVIQSQRWAEFDDKYRTQLLVPQSSMFQKISEIFIKLYADEYGECKYYLADVLHENRPASLENDVQNQLADYGQLVFKGIKSGNPKGIWVMQGWSFYFNSNFWNNDNVRALFSKVPDDEVIIIDLCNEKFRGWQKFNEYYGKKWIYSFVHNFGGNDPLNGDLKLFANSREPILDTGAKPLGFGISPEGINNNEVVYELLSDAAWDNNKIDFSKWLKNYCTYRYGKFDINIKRAWDILIDSTYNKSNANIKHGFQGRPTEKIISSVVYNPKVFKAARIMVELLEEYKESKFFLYDTIELIAQCGGMVCDQYLQICIDKKNSAQAEEIFRLLNRIDTLMSQVPHRNLSEWISLARGNAVTSQEADYYENNARRLLTTWGGKILADYAARMWSGLISSFYVERLKEYFASIDRKEYFDVAAWEEKWINSKTQPKKISIDDANVLIKETFALIEKMNNKCNSQKSEIAEIKIGKWAFNSNSLKSLKLDITQYISGLQKFNICFEETAKYLLPRISKFCLYENQQLILNVKENGKGLFFIELESKPGADYAIEVFFDDDEAHGSCGSISIQYGAAEKKLKKQTTFICKNV
jgi:alpha-N-acetylglucosaminidase